MPAWLSRARAAASQPPRLPSVALRLDTQDGGVQIGSIDPALARRIEAAGLPLHPGGDGWTVEGPGDTSLLAIARWLHASGVCARWRGELLPVVDGAGEVHAVVERSVVRALGLRTFAVHLAGRAADGRHWVQQRAFDKATDPGAWDTLMGGQQAAGESILATLERETFEEAGLSLAALRDLVRVEDVVVHRPVAEGYMDERIAVFHAVLADGLEPVNRDGEVVRFECLDRAALERRLEAGEFTLEATLILGAALGPRPTET